MLKRREFLSTTAVTSVGGLAVGCTSAIPRRATVPLTEAQGREVAERLEGALAGLDHLRLVSSEVGREAASTPPLRRYLEHADPMAKRAVQALVVSAAAKEVPVGTEAPPVLRRALDAKIPLLDQHVLETAALFKRLPLQERRRIARALREDPGAPERIAARIDRLGAAVGVHPEGRESLHRAARTIAFRLTKQPPSAFFDDQVAKVERVAGHRGLDMTVQRMIASHASTTAILQSLQQGGVSGGGGAGTGLTAPQPAEPVPTPPPPVLDTEVPPGQEQTEEEDHHRRGVIPAAVGGMLLGTGAILLGVSIPAAIADSGGWGWWIVITAGSLIALGGIIFLIVGAALAA